MVHQYIQKKEDVTRRGAILIRSPLSVGHFSNCSHFIQKYIVT